MTSSGRPHPWIPVKTEKRSFRSKVMASRRLWIGLLLVSIIVAGYGTVGVALSYFQKSNTEHITWSFGSTPIFVNLASESSNGSTVFYTLQAQDMSRDSFNNLYMNTTVLIYPLPGNFTLNGVHGLQWLTNGPFSMVTNQVLRFNYTLTYSGVIGYYDIGANVVIAQ